MTAGRYHLPYSVAGVFTEQERPRLTDWHFNLDVFLRNGLEEQEAQRTVFLRDDVQKSDDRLFVFSVVPAEQLIEAEALLQAEPRADPLSDPLHPQVVVDHVSPNMQRITGNKINRRLVNRSLNNFVENFAVALETERVPERKRCCRCPAR